MAQVETDVSAAAAPKMDAPLSAFTEDVVVDAAIPDLNMHVVDSSVASTQMPLPVLKTSPEPELKLEPSVAQISLQVGDMLREITWAREDGFP